MRIAVIGAGKVGTALGEGLARQDHTVTYGVPEPAKEKYAALTGRITTVPEAVAGAELVILATPWPATEAACKAMGDLGGAVLVDATNPLHFDESGLHLTLGFTGSGGEAVAGWTENAKVVKAFNATSYTNMSGTVMFDTPPMLIAASDHAEAKDVLRPLAETLGFEFYDGGPLHHARLLEPLARLSVHIQLSSGLGTGFALGVVKPNPGA